MDPMRIAACERSYRLNLAYWQSPLRREVEGKDVVEVAYSLLEAAALLLRVETRGVPQIPSQEQLPYELRQMCRGERMNLVKVTHIFMKGFKVPDYFSRIFEKECLDPRDLEEVQMMLLDVDALDAVADLTTRLLDDVIEKDSALRDMITNMRSQVTELIKGLSIRPDILMVASRAVLSQRQPQYLPNGEPADWFTKIRKQDQEFDSSDLTDLFPSS